MNRQWIGPRAVQWRWAIPMAMLAWLMPMPGARAHSAGWGKVTIDHPSALPANTGSSTKLYMRITNDEPATIYFFGVRTEVASETELKIWTGPGRSGTLDAISVRAGETLDLGTSHIWIALNGLTRDLVAGQTFIATANFGDRRDVDLTVLVAARSGGHTVGRAAGEGRRREGHDGTGLVALDGPKLNRDVELPRSATDASSSR